MGQEEPACEGFVGPCGRPGKKRECRTRYENDKLNVEPVLCDDCYQDYVEHWDDKWAEYYSGLMGD